LSLLTGHEGRCDQRSEFLLGQRLRHGRQAGAAHGVVFGQYRHSHLP